MNVTQAMLNYQRLDFESYVAECEDVLKEAKAQAKVRRGEAARTSLTGAGKGQDDQHQSFGSFTRGARSAAGAFVCCKQSEV